MKIFNYDKSYAKVDGEEEYDDLEESEEINDKSNFVDKKDTEKDTLLSFSNIKKVLVSLQKSYVPIKAVIKKENFYNPKTTFEVGDKLELGKFLYDSDNPIYINVFEEEFQELYKLMKARPYLRIEVSGHTDSTGTDEYNLKLSKSRSQSIVDALIIKGVDKNRLVSKGYGAAVPIAPNSTTDGKPDQLGMKLNRRVELRVIKSD